MGVDIQLHSLSILTHFFFSFLNVLLISAKEDHYTEIT